MKHSSNPFIRRLNWRFPALLVSTALLVGLKNCQAMPPQFSASSPSPAPVIAPAPMVPTNTNSSLAATPPAVSDRQILQQSWAAYRQRFIQPDGRVIDREANDRSTSEGQAYAMLRAVMIGDRATFDRTLQWAENNLKRQVNGKQTDSLWTWKWGQTPQGQWGVIDANFASDADVDAVTALILASRRWKHPPYLNLARTKLKDLWTYSTILGRDPSGKEQRFLLPGLAASFVNQQTAQLNPSYLAPAAFRLFAQIDPQRDWTGLVDSSYRVLQQATALSAVALPNDWILLDLVSGQVHPLATPNPTGSEYAFDAYRVWWRVATDAEWFREPRAQAYLNTHLKYPQQLWQLQRSIPARIDLQGKPLVNYEATSQYGMLYAGLRLVNPAVAQQIKQQKIMPKYRNGFWDNDSAYYTQNMVWLGLMPATSVMPFLKP
jgi:endoglucanase